MKLLGSLCMVCVLTSQVFAEMPFYYVAQEYNKVILVSVKINKEADYVSVPVTITSSCNDPMLRNQKINEAMRIFKEAAQNNRNIKIDSEIVFLSTQKTSAFKSSLRESYAKFNLLIPYDKEKHTIYACTEEIYTFIKTVTLPSKVESNYGETVLVIDKPEQYRAQLLQMIYDEIQRDKEIFKSNKVVVSGLENPISVQQINEHSVELYINYKLSFES